jgi:hypothetical protein
VEADDVVVHEPHALWEREAVPEPFEREAGRRAVLELAADPGRVVVIVPGGGAHPEGDAVFAVPAARAGGEGGRGGEQQQGEQHAHDDLRVEGLSARHRRSAGA